MTVPHYSALGGVEGRLGGPAEELFFPEALLQPFSAAAEGLGNCVRRGSQAALEDCEGPADEVPPATFPFLRKPLRPVHPLLDIGGDFFVELGP